MIYQDFDLLIDRTERGLRAQVLNSPAGQATIDFTLPFNEDKLENFLLRLGRARRTTRRVESAEMNAAKTFGAALFNAVFTGDVKACFRSSIDDARRQGAGLRLRLRLSDPSVVDLPWEFLYNPAVNRFIALSIQTPLVRYMDLPERIQPIAVTPPLRALVMISSPTDFPSLDVEGEWLRLNEALGHLVSSGQLAIDRLDAASLGELQKRLRKATYHIFHFIGHGEFNQESQEGVLILEGENERGHRVSSQYLGMLLHDHESLRVAILNACEGARTSRSDPFAGSAQSLVQQGIPAVIAMQFEIADDVAGKFAHEFYGAVADGYPIDAALTEARKAIFAAGREVEWGTPVLYLRSPDGRIFDVEQVTPPKPLSGSLDSGLHSVDHETSRVEKERVTREVVEAARAAFAGGQRALAIEMLRRYEPAREAVAGALRELVAEHNRLAEAELGAARDQAQSEPAAREEARRQAVRADVTAAASLLAEGKLSEAWSRACDALQGDPADPDVIAIEARTRRALEEQTAQDEARELERRLRAESEQARVKVREQGLAQDRGTIERHLDAGELEPAAEALAAAEAAYGSGAGLVELRGRLAQLRRQARARHDELADAAVAEARAQFPTSPADAVELLERFAPAHPRVSAVCRELKQLMAAQAERALREAERLAEEHRERLRAGEQRRRDLRQTVERIDAYLVREELAEADAALDSAESAFGTGEGLQELRERLAAAQRRTAHDQAALLVIAHAKRLAAAGDHETAISLLDRFQPSHPEVDAAVGAVRREAEHAARRQEVERRVAETIARAHRDPSHSAAIACLQEALALDPQHVELREALKSRRRALRQARVKAGLASLIHSRALLAVGVLVLLAAIGALLAPSALSWWRQIGNQQATGAPTSGSVGPGAATSTSSPATERTAPPAREGNPPPAVPASPAESSSRAAEEALADHRRRIRVFIDANNLEGALAALTAASSAGPDNAGLKEIAGEVLELARRDAARERAAAVARRASVSPGFRRGDGSFQHAVQLARQSLPGPAARAYREAADQFRTAAAPPPTLLADGTHTARPDVGATPAAGVPAVTVAEPSASPKPEAAPARDNTPPPVARADPPVADPPKDEAPAPRPPAPRATVEGALEVYETAVSKRDRAALLAVYPGASREVIEGLEKKDPAVKSYSLRILDIRVRPEGTNRARVECTLFHNVVAYSGKPQTVLDKRLITLERRGESWVIVDSRRR